MPSVSVSVLDKDGIPLEYYEPTLKDGKYILMFRAIEGCPMKLKFEKEGYTTLIKDYVPRRVLHNDTFPDVHLVKIIPDWAMDMATKIRQLPDRPNHKIKIYTSKELHKKNYKEILPSKIDYFTRVEKRESHTNVKGETGVWYDVSFKMKESDENYNAFLFENWPTEEISLK